LELILKPRNNKFLRQYNKSYTSGKGAGSQSNVYYHNQSELDIKQVSGFLDQVRNTRNESMQKIKVSGRKNGKSEEKKYYDTGKAR